MNDFLKNNIPLIPHKPGVYQMFNNLDQIIYIGKAKDLFKRVSQYFLRPQSGKVYKMVTEVSYFKYIVTRNEKESLILEMNLIHEYLPKYNILLKDNSHYPYIAISKNNNPYLKIARNTKDKNYYYFGPYPNSTDCYNIIDLLNKIFPLRKCSTLIPGGCIYKDMHQCLAPCINKIDSKEYENIIEEMKLFLNNRNPAIKNKIKNEMNKASENLNFELANDYKNILESIDKCLINQIVENPSFKSLDIVSYIKNNDYISLTILTYRNGLLLGKVNKIVTSFNDLEQDIINLLEQYYSINEHPKELAINLNDPSELEELLDIKIIKVTKGNIFEALAMGLENCKIELDKYLLTNKKNVNNSLLLEELANLLNIEIPYRIDLIDNSHLQGTNPVSCVISYINGEPYKSLYRKFHIEGQGNDDFNNMNVILKKRYLENKTEEKIKVDLLLVDGGLPQLNAIKDKYSFPIYGLFKDDNHHTKGLIDKFGKVYPIDNKSNLFFLLTRMQNEVHRFAISFHIKARSKSMFKSILDDINGLGIKRKELLLKSYPDIDSLMNASIDELNQILPNDVSELVYKKLHKSN